MHHRFFFYAKKYADMTAQPTPEDSRAWSQILVSLLTGINGLGRKKAVISSMVQMLNLLMYGAQLIILALTDA